MPFRIPMIEDGQVLREEQLEMSPMFLTRARRFLELRGIISNSRGDYMNAGLVADDLIALNHVSHEPITLFISSPGGDMGAGMMLYDIIRASKAPIICIGHDCCSMASLLLAAGHRRLSLPHSSHMIHQPQGQLAGSVEEIDIRQSVLRKIKDDLLDCYVECGVHAGLGPGADEKTIRAHLLTHINREHWLSAKEAVDYGLVDGIVTPDELFGKEPMGT